MDISDLQDHEIKTVASIWSELNHEWAHKPNTRANLQELAKVADEKFKRAGFVVNVQWENTLIIDPNTMEAMPIVLEVVGRVPDSQNPYHFLDHELKRHEVLRSKERNEAYLGQKGKSA